MPVVLVIVILVAWAVILGPEPASSGGPAAAATSRSPTSTTSCASSSTRAPEPIVAPAYRLRAVDGNGTPTGITYPDSGAPPKLTVVGAKELPRPALAFLGEPAPEPDAVLASGSPAAGPPRADRDHGPTTGSTVVGRPRAVHDECGHPAATPIDLDGPHRGDGFARQQARRRRRDTLAVLGRRLRRHPAGRRP